MLAPSMAGFASAPVEVGTKGNKIRCSPDAKRIRCPPFRPVDAWRRRKSDGHVSGKLLAPPNGSLSFLAPRASACMARQRGCMHREAGNWNRRGRGFGFWQRTAAAAYSNLGRCRRLLHLARRATSSIWPADVAVEVRTRRLIRVKKYSSLQSSALCNSSFAIFTRATKSHAEYPKH